jgi:hypothetical protein
MAQTEERIELIDSIPTQDSQGAWCVVDEFARLVRTRAADGAWSGWHEKERVLKCVDEAVVAVDAARFRVVATGEVLTRFAAS